MEHYLLTKLYRTLYISLFSHKLFLRSVIYISVITINVFYLWCGTSIYYLVLCFHFCRLCVVIGFMCFVLSALSHLLNMESWLNFVCGNKVGEWKDLFSHDSLRGKVLLGYAGLLSSIELRYLFYLLTQFITLRRDLV